MRGRVGVWLVVGWFALGGSTACKKGHDNNGGGGAGGAGADGGVMEQGGAGGAAPVDIPTTPGRHDITIQSGGQNRHFIVHIPVAYTGASAVPVVFFFHGAGSSADQGYSSRADIRALSESENFIFVVPNGQNATDNDGDSANWNAGWCCINPARPSDVEFFRDIVLVLEAGLNIDPNRVHPTGFSNGCSLVHRLAADAPDLVASAACSSGSVGGTNQDYPEYVVDPQAPVAMLHAHGDADPVVPYDGSLNPNGPLTPYSFDETISLWVQNNGCDPTPSSQSMPVGAFNAVVDSYSGCTSGADVVGATFEGMDHRWPPDAATPFMITFVLDHPKP
ncbi:MAG: alpha/beta hydrolase-fold protein [Polyangiaceae bacterium]